MKIILFLLIYISWYFSSIFISDISIYNEIQLPFFAPNPTLFGIVWPILYFLITISIIVVILNKGDKNIKPYFLSLIINYIFNQLFPIVFFNLENLFLSFVVSLFTFISSIYLLDESYKIKKEASMLLLPYTIWTLFATILSLTIYIIN